MLSAAFLCVLAIGFSDAELDRLVASVLPTPEENRFLEVGWRLDLMAAREEAERTNKPLFMWVMNGHPLGCT